VVASIAAVSALLILGGSAWRACRHHTRAGARGMTDSVLSGAGYPDTFEALQASARSRIPRSIRRIIG
jgi:hypothetical protein